MDNDEPRKGGKMTKKEAYEKLHKHIEGAEFDEYVELLKCLYVLIAKEGNKNAERWPKRRYPII